MSWLKICYSIPRLRLCVSDLNNLFLFAYIARWRRLIILKVFFDGRSCRLWSKEFQRTRQLGTHNFTKKKSGLVHQMSELPMIPKIYSSLWDPLNFYLAKILCHFFWFTRNLKGFLLIAGWIELKKIFLVSKFAETLRTLVLLFNSSGSRSGFTTFLPSSILVKDLTALTI